jgi:hypothetical protein
MGITLSGQLDDVDNSSYLTGTVSATTTQIEAKVGGSRLVGRQVLTLHNDGNATIYYGPTGLTSATGSPLVKNQFVSLPIGDNIGVFVLTASGTATVRVQEIG